MKHISILVPEGENNLSSIAGTYKILSRANEIWIKRNGKSLYQIQLAGASKKVGFLDGLFEVKPHITISNLKKTDFIIIPSLNHQYEDSIKRNRTMIDWIRNQYKNGAEIASICTGAFMLAETGIIDGKHCSTHWSAADAFRIKYPLVKLQSDKLITDENGIYTNGGAFSFLNLIIYLTEKLFNREIAIHCAKVFQIDMDRNMQSEFSIFNGHKTHSDEEILQAQLFIEKHFKDKISMEELSNRYHVGRRNFDRRFIKVTGLTPLDYLQRVKVEAAKKSLESTRKTVNEVMYEVGYNDTKAFREVFTRVTGISPVEYRTRYNKGN
ncbi:MAG: helix-turn-helix domain-containing protein [Bacteroidetes bacterium]|nr:helix-turn-helix domain-containing protein [Bacteroidota bacterium]